MTDNATHVNDNVPVLNDDVDDDNDSSSSMDSEEVDKILSKKYKRPGFACQYCGQKTQ